MCCNAKNPKQRWVQQLVLNKFAALRWQIMATDNVNHLKQGFPTCGTRTTGGTQTAARWYAESFQKQSLNKNTLRELKISRKIEHTTSILILKDGKNDTVADKRL